MVYITGLQRCQAVSIDKYRESNCQFTVSRKAKVLWVVPHSTGLHG